eukprot:GDKI01042880.1.p1 GENE.GDKI01042880.1~~GDKI01042880.1.p1  ORF type:complete len:218 (+),score=28.37 GDKI01042880.1:62-655(+)
MKVISYFLVAAIAIACSAADRNDDEFMSLVSSIPSTQAKELSSTQGKQTPSILKPSTANKRALGPRNPCSGTGQTCCKDCARCFRGIEIAACYGSCNKSCVECKAWDPEIRQRLATAACTYAVQQCGLPPLTTTPMPNGVVQTLCYDVRPSICISQATNMFESVCEGATNERCTNTEINLMYTERVRDMCGFLCKGN